MKMILTAAFLLMAAAPVWAEDKAAQQLTLLKQPWGRDPFKADIAAGAGAASGELELTGIFLRAGKRIAIINRKFIKEGEDAFGARIVKIEKDQVTVEKNNETTTLRIGNARPKAPAA